MAFDGVINFGKVEVSTGYDDAATTVVLASGEGSSLPDPAVVNYNLTWWNDSDYKDPSDDPNVEIVRVTAKSTDTLTVTRAQESTSATTKNTADKTYKMSLGVTAKVIDDLSGLRNTIVASSATPTPNADDDDTYVITALATDPTFGAPTGTPQNGQKLVIRVTDDGTARTLSWNAAYAGTPNALPTTTVVGETLYVGFLYNSATSKWDCIAGAAPAATRGFNWYLPPIGNPDISVTIKTITLSNTLSETVPTGKQWFFMGINLPSTTSQSYLSVNGTQTIGDFAYMFASGKEQPKFGGAFSAGDVLAGTNTGQLIIKVMEVDTMDNITPVNWHHALGDYTVPSGYILIGLMAYNSDSFMTYAWETAANVKETIEKPNFFYAGEVLKMDNSSYMRGFTGYLIPDTFLF